MKDHRHTVVSLGLDAFSVPLQQSGGGRAEGRMRYTAILYTADKKHHPYLVDFDLELLAGPMRQAALALGLGQADQLIAIPDAGKGIEAALRRPFDEVLLCIVDGYHARQHWHAWAVFLPPAALAKRTAWVEEGKGLLSEQGGEALLSWLRGLAVPSDAVGAEELRKVLNYFADNRHRTDYPEYRTPGWDMGSGPTEAACKIVGGRLKQRGMRWLEQGAADVASLRALYLSGTQAWDAFWAVAA